MTQVPVIEVVGAAVLVVAVWYLWANAVRIDRLHHGLAAARASLAAHLTRRAALAVEAAGRCDPATALILADAAADALDANLDEGLAEEPADPVTDEEWAATEEAHNDLTRALLLAFGDPDDVRQVFEPGDPLAVALYGACLKVQLARRFHNEKTATARRRRSKRIVRWARLAGHAPWPRMVEIDDAVPDGLEQFLPGASAPPVPPTGAGAA